MPVKIDRLTVHEDARGLVFEPLAPDLIAAQRNVHVVISGPGVVRGNHQHLKGTEIIAVEKRFIKFKSQVPILKMTEKIE